MRTRRTMPTRMRPDRPDSRIGAYAVLIAGSGVIATAGVKG